MRSSRELANSKLCFSAVKFEVINYICTLLWAIALADLSSGMIISSLSSVPPSESIVVSWTSISMCLVAVCNSTSVVPARLSYLLQSVV